MGSTQNQPSVIAFIGLGLIGGSIAKAMNRLSEKPRLMAWNPHMEKVQASIDEGVIDEALDSLTDPRLGEADLVFLCAPVQKNRENLKTILPFLKATATVTDIGSVKTDIHEAAIELGLEDRFVGGHPMAGSERTGYFAAKERLLENAYYIITASERAEESRIEMMTGLAASLGALPIRMDYREHDRVVAAVSHVPHVIAASLVHLVEDNDNPEHLMKTIAAGGFKDITRIASSSPQMWEEICMTNGDNITGLLQKYIDALMAIRDTIGSRKASDIAAFFSGARDYRDSFIEASSGPIKRVH
ncbi:MAG: prephenate dehydrogenase/arogenate dehydrogenase family protein, partial [Lachnospiraceae bacterium]|nr:prephenate dehydrogenase/arogenate dehydrogenase family protein [Lachnospiraceae bacterium]